jgi:ribonucleoside-diphosphate reductase alpha chain
MDCSILNGEHPDLRDVLSELKDVAIKTNKKVAKDLGIPASAAITCVKPSGTVSQLVDAASGIHARHSKHYIRTVRADNKDPLCDFMKQKGFKSEPCAMKGDKVTVFSFPIESPDNATVREDQNAIEQLELWLIYQRYWCEHKPSITVSVREHEWMDVGAWVYKHFDEISGISFLPYSEHTYAQAPYQECSKEEYEALLAETPTNIDWSELQDFEKEDNTAGSQTYACSGDSCEVVDLT